MASGKTHERTNVVLAPLFGFLLFQAGFSIIGLVQVFIGYLVGSFFMSPDNDTRSNSFYRWGWLRFIWIPYQKLFRHRSIFTHGIIIGDIIRMAYLFVWIYIPFRLLNAAHVPLQFVENMQLFIFYLFVGMALSSFAHIMLDILSSSFKRKKKRRKSKSRRAS